MHRIVMHLLLKVKYSIQNTVLKFEVPHMKIEICVLSRGEVTHTCYLSRKAIAIIPYIRQDLCSRAPTIHIQETSKY